jgi:hypothetical protein
MRQEPSDHRSTRLAWSSYWALSEACKVARRTHALIVEEDHLLAGLLRVLPPVDLGIMDAVRRLRRQIGATEFGSAGSAPAELGSYRSDLDLELDGALREARSEAWRQAGVPTSKPPPWSARARAVVWDALITASSAEVRLMGAGHVLEASLGAADDHMQALLRQHELDVQRLRDAAHASIAVENNEPWTPCAGDLWRCRVAVPIDGPGPGVQFPRLLVAYTIRKTQASPTLYSLELEAARQATRLGHPRVTTAHLVAAIVAVDDQLRIARLAFAPEYAEANRAGAALSRTGVCLDGTLRSLATMTFDGAVAPADRRRLWRSKPWLPRWTVDAVEAAENARSAGGRKSAGSSHLLAAALGEGGGPAWRLLDELGVDPRALLGEDVR